MGSDKRIHVAMTLTADPELLPVVRGLVGQMAEQMGFKETQRLNLQQGVQQACRRAMAEGIGKGGETLHLDFTSFPDRIEIVVEEGVKASLNAEANSFLLNQLLDRVVFEETDEGKLRLTLVKYLSPVGSQP